jgi:hypothetical protein
MRAADWPAPARSNGKDQILRQPTNDKEPAVMTLDLSRATFLIFAFDDYYPAGGLNDLKATETGFEVAKATGAKLRKRSEHVQIAAIAPDGVQIAAANYRPDIYNLGVAELATVAKNLGVDGRGVALGQDYTDEDYYTVVREVREALEGDDAWHTRYWAATR